MLGFNLENAGLLEKNLFALKKSGPCGLSEGFSFGEHPSGGLADRLLS